MFGSHLSIAGGMHNAFLAAEGYGMETVQVFTKKCRTVHVLLLSG
jgi:endonuclease IV